MKTDQAGPANAAAPQHFGDNGMTADRARHYARFDDGRIAHATARIESALYAIGCIAKLRGAFDLERNNLRDADEGETRYSILADIDEETLLHTIELLASYAGDDLVDLVNRTATRPDEWPADLLEHTATAP